MEKQLTSCCPECGCAEYYNPNLCGDGHRTCKECDQEWWTDVTYAKKFANAKAPDFRVGDAVSRVIIKTGEVIEITKRGAVCVEFKDGSRRPFSPGGARTLSGGKELYHGQDPKVTVEEKPPVRMVERWLTVFFDTDAGETISYLRNSDERVAFNAGNGVVIHGPIKVQIPEQEEP